MSIPGNIFGATVRLPQSSFIPLFSFFSGYVILSVLDMEQENYIIILLFYHQITDSD